MMDVKQIIKQYLAQNKYDGLFCDGECACKVDHLAPCGNISDECQPGYLIACSDNNNWHIVKEKPSRK